MLEHDKTVYICKLEDQLEEAHDLLGKCQALLKKRDSDTETKELLDAIREIIGD